MLVCKDVQKSTLMPIKMVNGVVISSNYLVYEQIPNSGKARDDPDFTLQVDVFKILL